MRIDPLHGRDAGQNAFAAAFDDVKLEPRNVVRSGGRRASAELAHHGAAVDVFPIRPDIVAADGFAVEEKRRNRLAGDPAERAVVAGLAFVDLRAFGMQHRDHGFAGGGNGSRQFRGLLHENPRASVDQAIAFFKFSSILSRKPSVESHF